MNNEQIKSLIRQAMLFIGGIIAGTSFVSKFFTADQVTAILTSDTVINTLVGLVTAGLASFWALLSRTNKNLVIAADAVPGVKGVITQATQEGVELAKSVPSSTVVPASTSQAQEMAKG